MNGAQSVVNANIQLAEVTGIQDFIGAICPPGTCTAEAHGDMPDGSLFAGEAEVVRNAVEKRRREFSAGRLLARRALRTLGHPSVPVLVGTHREPRWPAGIIGSITHCSGYCGAAVRHADPVIVGLGIDAEPNEPLPDGVIAMIARPDELSRTGEYPHDGTCWDRLLFSAKESVFKAWFPVERSWLDFFHAQVRFDPARHTFEVRLINPPASGARSSRHCRGRYAVGRGLLATAVALERSA